MNAIFSNVNWLHVLVATIAYYILGAIWYSFLFQKKWIQYQNINVNDPNAKKGVGAIMFLAFIAFFVITFCIDVLVHKLAPVGGITSAVKLGLFTGIGFSAATLSINYLYTKRPIGLHFIDGIFHIVGQIIAAIILIMWK